MGITEVQQPSHIINYYNASFPHPAAKISALR